MKFVELLQNISSHYEKLSNLIIDVNLKISCKDLFDSFSFNGDDTEILEFITNVKTSLQKTSSDILNDLTDQGHIIKTMQAQVGFFLSFYSYLVSKKSFIIDDAMKDEISSWFVDILSNLNLCMGNSDWKLFMANFVISYHPYLATILFDIYESLGLDIPSEIEPVGYKVDEDISYEISAPIVQHRKKLHVKKISFEDSLKSLKEKESRNSYRSVLDLDRPLEMMNKLKKCPALDNPMVASTRTVSRSKSSVSHSESNRRKSGEKKGEVKEGSAKKTRKRRSLVPETPNLKREYVARSHRAAVAAAKKLNGKVLIIAESPLPDRTYVSTPTTQRKLRRATSITAKMLGGQNGPITEIDMWIKRRHDEERSLTNFSTDSFDLHRTSSVSSLEGSTKRITRFRSKLFDSFMSPTKDTNVESTISSLSVLSPGKSKITKVFPIFSPKKTPIKSMSPKSILSPRKTAKKQSPSSGTLLSPKKIRIPSNITSPKNSALPTTPVTLLKSCLKSPLKRRPAATNDTDNSLTVTKRRKTIANTHFPGSVLLSPKVKQRTFITNRPPQDYCEDTMYMDTNEFIRSSGAATNSHVINDHDSPLLSYLGDSSQSSFCSFSKERVKAVPRPRLSVQRKLFDASPSGISAGNILPTSRRRTICAPNFNCLDPETDESNGFKI